MNSLFSTERIGECLVVRLQSADGTNRLTRECVEKLTSAIARFAAERSAAGLVITGNEKFFSAGADLREISALNGKTAYEFSKIGQQLMAKIAEFPAPVYAAISGYCMGGGLDLALACRHRVASPHAVFGHRGAALGLITGWGGTQRLPRLIGKAGALEIFIAAEKIRAERALEIGLIESISDDPIAEALRRISRETPAVEENA
ncbi:MAG TPA: enoyl-CoA hydratase/isomerase family protein [Candidatus Sulfotelmatobacter sp.]|nr:enoyl-CoA hydratase/isomerase family protein [Candidatus Sulfotelmatobacter sp.]